MLDSTIFANAIALGVEPIGTVVSHTASGIEIPSFLNGKVEVEQINSIGTEEQPNIEKVALMKSELILGFDYFVNYDQPS